MEIEDLVEKAKNGDKEAYSELITSIQVDLYKIARSRLKTIEDSQDAVQETIINAYLGINKLKNNKTFKSWIIKILINECNHIYNKHKRNSEIDQKFIVSNKTEDYLNDNIDFDNLIKTLNEKERKIFKLHYEDGFSIKQLSNMLDMNENTIKTTLNRGKLKIKKSYKPATIFMFILCLLVATSVIAVSIISYIKSLFELNSIGANNSGVLMAIEHLDWFKQTDMDYINLDDSYKVKLDYLLVDEMNLYLVFDITSEEDISKFTDVSFPDLRIINENGDVICDEANLYSDSYNKRMSAKTIENDKNHMKVLVYMYTDSFPISKSLDISFSKLEFLKKSFLRKDQILYIDVNINFKIDLSEKFINRRTTIYTSNSPDIEKAILTETGFYAIIKTNNFINSRSTYLIDENNNLYECYTNILTFNDNSYSLRYIVIASFNDTEVENLKLVSSDTEYKLVKE